MRRWIRALALLLALTAVSAAAEEEKSPLRQSLERATQSNILAFCEADYDGDGDTEAFVLLGDYDWDGYLATASLWYMCGDFFIPCETEGGCYPSESGVIEQDGLTCFRINEGYGGSGSNSRLWTVRNQRPVMFSGTYNQTESVIRQSLALVEDKLPPEEAVPAVPSLDDDAIAPSAEALQAASGLEGLTPGAGSAWYAFPSYFDMFTDGTGHTWKRYYYYYDGQALREYGGIYIPLDDVTATDGGLDALTEAQARGMAAAEAIYRGNGIVNVNLVQDDACYYITLLYEDGDLTLLDDALNPAESFDAALDAGHYLTAHTPDIADYPAAGFGGGASEDPGYGDTHFGEVSDDPGYGDTHFGDVSDSFGYGGGASGASRAAQVAFCNEYISLRAYPSTGAERLAKVPLGARVEVVGSESIPGDGGAFVEVSYQGMTGYVLEEYLLYR